MARRGLDINDLVIIGGIALLAGYAGLLGETIKCKIRQYLPPACPGTGGGTGGTCNCPTSVPASGYASINPNIYQQIVEWQSARIKRGENPCDWAAFRQHLGGIGAPDPGPTPFTEFCKLRTSFVSPV
jgi:hypothetical protein